MKLSAFSPSPSAAQPVVKKAAFGDCRASVIALLGMIPTLRVAHWQASTKTNEHKALGDLYEALDGLIDDFAETLMGLDGNDRSFESHGCTIEAKNEFAGIVKRIRDEVNKVVEATSSEADLNNIAADMRQAVNKACYLLEIA